MHNLPTKQHVKPHFICWKQFWSVSNQNKPVQEIFTFLSSNLQIYIYMCENWPSHKWVFDINTSLMSRSRATWLFFFWQHVSVIVKYSWIHLPHRSILNHLACTRCQPCVIFLAEVFIKGSRFLYVYWIYATPWNSILITSTFSILNIDCCEISHKMCEKKWRARNCI